METFGVVGAGTMGSGIAQKIAIEGYPVTLVDLSDEALERGKALMEGVFQESVKRRILTEEKAQAIRDRLTFTTDYNALKDADLVVEAVFEDQAIKAKVFKQLEAVLRDDAVIATNTSSFPVTELAKGLAKPGRFVGLHYFFHPVKNRLLEVIPGPDTTPETLAKARSFCTLQGKVEILCSDSPGFVVNRFFVPWLNEAVRLLSEGLATLDVIEHTCKQGFRLGMGPFELMNVTGVPIGKHAADGLADYLGGFYRPDELLNQQVGKGKWEIGETTEFSQAVFDRMLGVTWAVSATLVDEGTCTPLDVDLGAQVGLRWPKGPFAVFNMLPEEAREAAIKSFFDKHSGFPCPKNLTPDAKFALPTVLTEKAGDVAKITLARPDKSNALNAQVFSDLDQAITEAEGSMVLVLKGLGKNFAAGADIRFFVKNMEQGKVANIISFTAKAQNVLKRLESFSGKVVCLVDGFALGGGAEMMLAAGLVIATPRATLGFPETGIGIFPGLGGCWRLAKRIGKGLAKYLVGTGQMLDGRTACAIGLVDHCYPPIKLASAAQEELVESKPVQLDPKWAALRDFFDSHTLDELLASDFSEEWQQKIQKKLKFKAPIALRIAFELIDNSDQVATIEEEYKLELERLPEVFNSEDAMVGLKSIGKYKPEFSGK